MQIEEALAGKNAAADLAKTGPKGSTVAHAMVAGMHVFKAGEISRLLSWVNTSFTLYHHDFVRIVERAVRPLLREMLKRKPELASAATRTGIVPLHYAALTCSDGLAEELLAAGASPSVTGAAGISVFQLARNRGCIELLGTLLRAMPAGAAREREVLAAVEYARLPGAAILPAHLEPLLGLLPDAVRPVSPLLPGRPRRSTPPQARVLLDSSSCAEGGGWDVEPPPSEEERAECQIDALDTFPSEDELFQKCA
jgi:hypothetical protein